MEVRREIVIEAAPATVWEFLVEPDKLVRWMGIAADFEARPGAPYRVDVLSGNVAAGEVLAVEPERRLVMSWGWEQTQQGATQVGPGESTVEFELLPHPSGTLLRFEHRDLPNEREMATHGQGWEHYLERLRVVASGGDPGYDPWRDGLPVMPEATP